MPQGYSSCRDSLSIMEKQTEHEMEAEVSYRGMQVCNVNRTDCKRKCDMAVKFRVSLGTYAQMINLARRLLKSIMSGRRPAEFKKHFGSPQIRLLIAWGSFQNHEYLRPKVLVPQSKEQ